jgi:hypothetical protein
MIFILDMGLRPDQSIRAGTLRRPKGLLNTDSQLARISLSASLITLLEPSVRIGENILRPLDWLILILVCGLAKVKS